VELEDEEVDALAMVLGELCVNSTKHGALKRTGRVSLEAVSDEKSSRVIWLEEMDHPIKAHARDGGKGLTLMRRVLRARGGDIELDWLPRGLRASIFLKERAYVQNDCLSSEGVTCA
jgi:two-component sensor histidine kinase